jgi:hypothetical protein
MNDLFNTYEASLNFAATQNAASLNLYPNSTGLDISIRAHRDPLVADTLGRCILPVEFDRQPSAANHQQPAGIAAPLTAHWHHGAFIVTAVVVVAGAIVFKFLRSLQPLMPPQL